MFNSTTSVTAHHNTDEGLSIDVDVAQRQLIGSSKPYSSLSLQIGVSQIIHFSDIPAVDVLEGLIAASKAALFDLRGHDEGNGSVKLNSPKVQA